MKRGINLRLPKKKTSQAVVKAISFSFVFFLLSVALGIILIAVNLFFGARIAGLKNEEEGLKNQILSQDTKLYKLYDTHQRLKSIDQVVKGRSKVIDKVDNVAAIVPQEAEVNTITTKDLQVTFSIVTTDLSKINEVLEQKLMALALEQDKKVKRVELKSLALDPEDKEYTLDFIVTF